MPRSASARRHLPPPLDRLEAATFAREARPPRDAPDFSKVTDGHPTDAQGELSGNVLFYSKPEPLAKELHSKLGVKRMDGPFGFAKTGHAIPLTVGEFPLSAVTGPIIFVGDEKLPIAVMGLNSGENMFVKDDGTFESGIYIPGLRAPLSVRVRQRRRQQADGAVHRPRRRVHRRQGLRHAVLRREGRADRVHEELHRLLQQLRGRASADGSASPRS
jgi:hypothetical protein